MKVSALIKELEQCNSDAEVVVRELNDGFFAESGVFSPVSTVGLEYEYHAFTDAEKTGIICDTKYPDPTEDEFMEQHYRTMVPCVVLWSEA
jgi:hypothetical protein